MPAFGEWKSVLFPFALIFGGWVWLNTGGQDPPAVKEAKARRRAQERLQHQNAAAEQNTSMMRLVKKKQRRLKEGKKVKKSSVTPALLMNQAEEALREGRAEDAKSAAGEALRMLQQSGATLPKHVLSALSLLATISLELGDSDSARSYFLQAVDLDPDGSVPDDQGGGAEKFLCLAQLSEEGGHESVEWFKKGAEVLRKSITALQTEHISKENGADSNDEITATKTRLASALCGIIEIYMTDLSFEPTAETTCSTLIQEAITTAPFSPEPYQTLASIRISQSGFSEARTALRSSMALWQEGPPSPESTYSPIPDFPTRISLARLLMEVGMEEEALGVVERLVEEDDGSVEAWYLGGWCLYLLGHDRNSKSEDGEEEKAQEQGADDSMTDDNPGPPDEKTIQTSLISSREWLRQSLNLYDLVDYEDDRLRDHALELVSGLDKELEGIDVDVDGGADDDDEWEGISDDDEKDPIDGNLAMDES